MLIWFSIFDVPYIRFYTIFKMSKKNKHWKKIFFSLKNREISEKGYFLKGRLIQLKNQQINNELSLSNAITDEKVNPLRVEKNFASKHCFIDERNKKIHKNPSWKKYYVTLCLALKIYFKDISRGNINSFTFQIKWIIVWLKALFWQ